jgi:hypothetical protein
MKTHRITAWIGALSVIATATGLLLSISKRVGAKPDNAGLVRREAAPIASGWGVRDHQPAPSRNDEPSQSVEEAHVRQASLRSAVRETLPFPPLLTRCSPARPPTSDHGAAADQRDVVPMPPVPSKVSPGAILEQARDDSIAIDRTESPKRN